MKKNYFMRSMLLFGAAAVAGMAYADTYVDVTRQYIKDPTFTPGWQGVLGKSEDGVGQVWDAAFRTYQNLGEMPAGHYVLTANALYRCGNNDYAKAHQAGNPDLNTCYIFINDAKTTVTGLWEGRETAPNSRYEANEAFSKGEYLNKVEYDHKGGELIIGICNTGCYSDEWAAFDNFVLTCDGVAVEGIINADFSEGHDANRSWNNEPSNKVPDLEKDGMHGGDFRKCGGSPYNHGQQVELPAGTYRFSMLCFHRYGSTVDKDGVYYNHKWPCGPGDAYGSMNRSPKDWFEAGDYDKIGDDKYAHAYIYMSKNEIKPKSLAWSESDAEGDLIEGVDVRCRVKDCWEICNGDLDIMPQNNPMMGPFENGDPVLPYETKNKCIKGEDSGQEREAAAAFVNDPEKWLQYVEFTLTEPTKVWLGLGKDASTGDGYWHAYADIKLEKVIAGEDTPAEKTVLWKNGVQSTTEWVDWNGVNRFGLEGMDGGNECAYTFTASEWNALKTNPFYIVIKDIKADEYHQLRITDGWWSETYHGIKDEDSADLEVDNGDGTRTVKIDLTGENSPLLGTIDEKHLLFTGHNFVLDEIYVIGVDGIASTIFEPVRDNRIFNMLGVEVDSNYKGIVIKNGKKYIQR